MVRWRFWQTFLFAIGSDQSRGPKISQVSLKRRRVHHNELHQTNPMSLVEDSVHILT